MSRREDVGTQQKRAWGFYGLSGMPTRPVGEVRYVVGWQADQMTRLDWDVLINGSEEWSVTLPAAEGVEVGTIATKQADGEEDVTEASRQLLELIDWTDTNVRSVTTNLFVPGQGDYVQTDDGWEVVSTIDPDRKKKLESRTVVPFLWPHPADPKKPDAPLFAVLELLDELDWLNRQSRTQSRQRVLISGVQLVADGFNGPNDTTFWDVWNDAMKAKMVDPDDLSPIQLSGALELIKDGFRWETPDFKYDDLLDRRVSAAIQRLAYGLPVPPEILLGMQAQSRATAFQVEENAYRAHIEPPALQVAQVAQDALNLILDDEFTVQIIPNPGRLLARKNSVQDVKDAYDRGLVTPEYVREVLGIPEDAAPEDDGVAPAGVPVAESDPANDAAGEASPINASTGDTDLSTLLADIDSALASELAGATVMATDRARQRLGAAVRTVDNTYRSGEYKGLSNAQLAVKLGFDGLSGTRIDVADQIAEPIDSASKWWVSRVGQVWNQISELVPGWSGQGDWVTESVDVLAESLVAHIMDTLDQDVPPPLEAGQIRAVVDVAAGDR